MVCICTVIITLIVILVTKKIVGGLLASSRRKKLFAKLKLFQAERQSHIKSTTHLKSSLSESLKKEIILSDALTLVKMLNEGRVNSYELLLVFYERAITIGEQLGALAEINIEGALEQAKKCDEVRLDLIKNDPSKLSTLPPLFGVPMSIKSNISIKGLSNNLGCVNFIDNKPAKNGFILDLLISKTGIIPFVTSNVPQCLMVNETNNRIYGRSKNPWNEERVAGGSSGGEASLLASGCSPIGMGNDIGGSIRIPCLYSGLYGMKVTTNRMTLDGCFTGNKTGKRGNINVKACNGPMGKTVEDLAIVLKSLLVEELFVQDLEVVPLSWNDENYKTTKKLRIGYVENDKFFAVSKGNKRAVEVAVKALEAKGHELLKLDFPNFEEGVVTYLSLMSSAGKFRPYVQMMADEPPIPEYNQLIKITNIPRFIRGAISKILGLIGENRAAKLLPKTHAKSAWEFFGESERQQVVKKDFIEWWRANKLDALISPGLPNPAMKHGESADGFLSCCYTFFFNLIDYPTGVVPITTIQKDEEAYEDPVNRDKYERVIRESMKGSEGLPLGVQVTTLPYQEELCLNVMKQIEEKVGFHKLPIKI